MAKKSGCPAGAENIYGRCLYPMEKAVFERATGSYIKSINVGLDRMTRGSQVEYAYINEKLEKLKTMVNDHYVVK